MANDNEDYPSDSDENDEDFCPENLKDSDVSTDGENDDLEDKSNDEDGDDDNDDDTKPIKKSKKKTKKIRKTKEKKFAKTEMKNSIKTEVNQDQDDTIENPSIDDDEEAKKKSEALWADFLSDVNTSITSKQSKDNALKEIPSENSKGSTATITSSEKSDEKQSEKVKIKQIYDFAGETVVIEKEVPANSVSNSIANINKNVTKNTPPIVGKSAKPSLFGGTGDAGRGVGIKRPGSSSGLGAILGLVGKKTKMSVLEKSKLDWSDFKQKEGINEEIETFNKGKDGYLERQDFLQRTDLKQFEIESTLRKTSRSSKR